MGIYWLLAKRWCHTSTSQTEVSEIQLVNGTWCIGFCSEDGVAVSGSDPKEIVLEFVPRHRQLVEVVIVVCQFDAGVQELMVPHVDRVAKANKVVFVHGVNIEDIICINTVYNSRVGKQADDLDRKPVVSEAGCSHFACTVFKIQCCDFLQLCCDAPRADKVLQQQLLHLERGQRTLPQGPPTASARLVVHVAPQHDRVNHLLLLLC